MSRAIYACKAEFSSDAKRSAGNVVKRIGIVLYDGFSLTATGTMIEALHMANELQESVERKGLTYNVCLISARGGMVTCSSSVCVFTERLDAQCLHDFDAIYVAGGAGATRASEDDRLIHLLKVAASQGITINALGNGHELLTTAGLIFSNWSFLERDASAKGASRPQADRSDALVHSLALLKRDIGYDIAASVAERLVFNNDQHVSSILSKLGTPTVAEKARESARWLERNCGSPVSMIDAARLAAMSERNFWRLFKREIGLTPSQYLLRARLQLSCQLLTSSELPIDKIARRTGLSNGERMSKLFRKQFSMSPTEYRARNRGVSASQPEYVDVS